MWCGRNKFQSVQCSINFDNWRFSFDGRTSESWWKKKVERDDKRGRKRNYRLTNMEIKKEKKGKKVPLKYSVKLDERNHRRHETAANESVDEFDAYRLVNI